MYGDKQKKGIYFITNTVNHKIYVGSTTNTFRRRFQDHKRKLKKGIHQNEHLQNAWNKYGEKSFVFSIVEILEDNQEIRKREKYYIDKLSVCNPKFGYNVNSETEFHKVEDSTKEKLSKIAKEMWKNGKFNSEYNKGRPSWNKGLKCENISTTRRQMFGSVEIYKNDHLIVTFRSATDLDEWSKENSLPQMEFYRDKHNRPNLGKRTSHIAQQNIHRAIREGKPYRGFIFKKGLPLSPEIGIAKWENCWNGEAPNQQPSLDLTTKEGSTTNS